MPGENFRKLGGIGSQSKKEILIILKAFGLKNCPIADIQCLIKEHFFLLIICSFGEELQEIQAGTFFAYPIS
jgi:hypothetical protein